MSAEAEKQFVLVFLPGTDESPQLKSFNGHLALDLYLTKAGLHPSDYAVIEGRVVKGFNQ